MSHQRALRKKLAGGFRKWPKLGKYYRHLLIVFTATKKKEDDDISGD